MKTLTNCCKCTYLSRYEPTVPHTNHLTKIYLAIWNPQTDYPFGEEFDVFPDTESFLSLGVIKQHSAQFIRIADIVPVV